MKKVCSVTAFGLFVLTAVYLKDAGDAGQITTSILGSRLMLKAFCAFCTGTLLGVISLMWPNDPRHFGE